MGTYVLVHGGWDGAWFWRPVARLLQRAGHEVFTPTLTGLGERVHLAHPAIGLEIHTKDIINVLRYEDLRSVVLVGFSYSGMVITGVAEQMPDRLAYLVYCDAFVPADGQSLRGLVGPRVWAYYDAIARTEGEGWRIPIAYSSRSTPNLVKPLTDPVSVSNPAATVIPRAYIYCAQKEGWAEADGPLREAAARAQAQNWHYREIAAGHAVMQQKPKTLADLLLELM